MTRPLIILICADSEWKTTSALIGEGNGGVLAGSDWRQVKLGGIPVIFFHTGWGKIAAAAGTQAAIDQWHPSVLVNLGTCGGLAGRVEIGDIIFADKVVVYDIVEQIISPEAALAHYSTTLWPGSVPEAFRDFKRTTLLSADRDVLCEDVEWLIRKFDGQVADWESGAIGFVARRNGIKLFILRVVSDLVSTKGGTVYGQDLAYQAQVQTGMARLLEFLRLNIKEFVSAQTL